MAYTPQDAANFYNQGRDLITRIAQVSEDATSWSRTFEARGGALALGDPYGDACLEMIYFWNDYRAFLAANNGQYQVLLDNLRTDYFGGGVTPP